MRQPAVDQVGPIAARSVRWAIGAAVLRQALTLVSMMVVARFVSPDDTGVAALALTVMALVVLIDTGLTWATVQPEHLSRSQIDGMFWIGVALGLTLWAVCAASGSPLGLAFDAPELVQIMPVIGLAAFFNSLSTQPSALLKRQLRQKSVALVETVSILVGSLVAVVIAVAGGGHWAIVLQVVATHLLRAALYLPVAGYRPSYPKVPKEAWRLARIGGAFAVSNYVCYPQLYLGALVVGRVFSMADLGLYARANALKALPTQYAAMVVTDVMVASLAALKSDPDRMAAAYRKALGLTALVGCPAGAFLYVAAPELVALLYGPDWSGAAAMLQALSPAAVALPITTTTIWLFLAAGKARAQLVMNLALTAAVILIFTLGATFAPSAEAFVLVEGVTSAILLCGVSVVVSHRMLGLPLAPTALKVAPILMACLTAVIACEIAFPSSVEVSNPLSAIASLAAQGAVFGVVFLMMVAVTVLAGGPQALNSLRITRRTK